MAGDAVLVMQFYDEIDRKMNFYETYVIQCDDDDDRLKWGTSGRCSFEWEEKKIYDYDCN